MPTVIVHVHNTKPSEAGRKEAHWLVDEQTDGGPLVQRWMARNTVLRHIKLQTSQGHLEPSYTIRHTSAMLLTGPLPRGLTRKEAPLYAQRYVFWQGFEQPTLMLVQDLK